MKTFKLGVLTVCLIVLSPPAHGRTIVQDAKCPALGTVIVATEQADPFILTDGNGWFRPPRRRGHPKPLIEAGGVAHRIAHGHAWGKHGAEFPSFRNPREFAAHIDRVIRSPTEKKSLSGGRTAYWDGRSQTIVITNPHAPDGGTAFRPKKGKAYFDTL